MRTVLVIGIGAGDPDMITLQAVRALNRVDVIMVLDKGKESRQLVEFREEICRRHLRERPYRIVEIPDPRRPRRADGLSLTEYEAAVRDWHAKRAKALEATLLEDVPEDGCAAFLVIGDPSLYDSTIRVVHNILDRGNVEFDWEVIPGITSLQALTARHRVPLNQIGEQVVITTGRRLTADPSPPEGTTAVMLDDALACQAIDDPGVRIYWGANIGTPEEVLRSGPLTEVIEEIVAARAELRERTGWVLDTYLLRRE
ncbi:precorrin-6A synthase [Amycolatopsis xylanica]|uniref:Precorrin-6A synthase n=1 Tax=Amycolatopsis xylanica TaxID=589385 RepID=A0A1H2W236_9PSEU|nr:precorrin-6A synthase (deacetylating) [Amycolatopsis xylanica]SDW74294.1 precorrin-6A synthase [Amycolatopsis xylanica]